MEDADFLCLAPQARRLTSQGGEQAAIGPTGVVSQRRSAGQVLGDHQVKEHAFIVVVDGKARIEAGGEAIEADTGTLVAFEPDERHVVASDSGAKLLLMLAPWPGEGHYRGGGGPAA